jgi:hypothetical protein
VTTGAVAMTAIISGRVVELAAIVTGGVLVKAAIPQFRMQAPAKTDNGSNGTPDGGKK